MRRNRCWRMWFTIRKITPLILIIVANLTTNAKVKAKIQSIRSGLNMGSQYRSPQTTRPQIGPKTPKFYLMTFPRFKLRCSKRRAISIWTSEKIVQKDRLIRIFTRESTWGIFVRRMSLSSIPHVTRVRSHSTKLRLICVEDASQATIVNLRLFHRTQHLKISF